MYNSQNNFFSIIFLCLSFTAMSYGMEQKPINEIEVFKEEYLEFGKIYASTFEPNIQNRLKEMIHSEYGTELLPSTVLIHPFSGESLNSAVQSEVDQYLHGLCSKVINEKDKKEQEEKIEKQKQEDIDKHQHGCIIS